MHINHVCSEFSFPRVFNFASSKLYVFKFPYETITTPVKRTRLTMQGPKGTSGLYPHL